jgi:hypothetical protein
MVHLLVYLADRKLTGSIVLAYQGPNGPVQDVVYFLDGAAAKVRTEQPIAQLGESLVPLGFVTDEVRRSSFDAAS